MKRGTPDHPKVDRLCALLGIGTAQAVGHLELLWHFAARYAIQGDVGKYENATLASKCKWDGDADSFISAMVEAGWLEPHTECRLLVHDWSDHADQSVKKTLSNNELEFFPSSRPETDGMILETDGMSPPTPGYGYGYGKAMAKAQATARAETETAFDSFWDAWPKHPRKASKAKCLVVWKKKRLADQAEHIVAVVRAMAKSPMWTREGGAYIPAPLVWLNQERWDGFDPATIQVAATNGMTAFEILERQKREQEELET